MTDQIAEIPDALAQFVEAPTDVVTTVVDGPVIEAVEPVTLDPIAEKASKGGWTDKEAWTAAGKDPDEWIDAKEFVSRKPLYDKLHAQAKALKDKEEKLEAVSKYAAKASEAGYKRAMAELQAEKREAIQLGDVDAVEAVDKRIEEVKQELQPPEPKVETPQIPPEVKDFADRNDKWFEKDKAMTVFMVESTREYTAAGKTLGDALKLAEADVKKEFAHKFVNPNKDKPAAVSSGNRETRSKTHGYSDLSAEQKQVWSVLKNSGMTIDKYIKGLAEAGDLK